MLKVAIIGPESTGKTTLAQQLAKRYNAIFVPEYAREYVEALNRPYTYDDVCAIARHQIAQMKQYTEDRSDKIVIYDTELIITRVWFDYCYGSTPHWVLDAMEHYKPDVYLLMYPDLAWVDDPVRENGGDAIRLELYNRYLQEIRTLKVPCYIIRHTHDGNISASKMA